MFYHPLSLQSETNCDNTNEILYVSCFSIFYVSLVHISTKFLSRTSFQREEYKDKIEKFHQENPQIIVEGVST